MVRVQWDGLHIRQLDTNTGILLREHLRQQRGRHRIKDEDRSKKTPFGAVQLLARAAQAGPSIGQFAKARRRCGADCKVSDDIIFIVEVSQQDFPSMTHQEMPATI